MSTEGELTGVVDLIRDWPERGTWIIGLLLRRPRLAVMVWEAGLSPSSSDVPAREAPSG